MRGDTLCINTRFLICLFIKRCNLKKWLTFCLTMACIHAFAQEYNYRPSIFTNSRMDGNYFYSKVEWQSPSWAKNVGGKLPVHEKLFFTPGNSLQLHYVNGDKGNWRASVYRSRLRGQDFFTPATLLSFKIFVSSKGTTLKSLPAIRAGLEDSTLSSPLEIGKYISEFGHGRWLAVYIPLKDFRNIGDLNATSMQSVQFVQNDFDKMEHELLIDDIELVSSLQSKAITVQPALQKAKGFARHIDIEWKAVDDDAVRWVKIYRSTDGKTFIPVGVQLPIIQRYADFTGEENKKFFYQVTFLDDNYRESKPSSIVSANTRTMNDQDLLTMVQEAAFRYYWDGAEKVSGLSKENIPGRQHMVASGASGFGLMALIAGAERRFITRAQLINRFKQILAFLEKADTFHGAYSHFIDGPTAKAEPFFGERDNGGDLVETSFLMQGLLTARAYFNKAGAVEQSLRDRITKIWHKVEWNWYKQFPDSKYLYWHWSPTHGWEINHKLIGWNETMITYLLAIASPTFSIDASLYYSGWASQDEEAIQYRQGWGQTSDGSKYTNGNVYFGVPLEIGVSNGGPLFFIHYSFLGYDPKAITDKYTNYFRNNKRIAEINYRYCLSNPGGYTGYSDSCWGLTACDGPFHYSASEPVSWQDDGKIAPTGAISSFPYLPDASMKALRNYYYQYGHFLWGEFGFRDAFNLSQNWCSEIFMGLNQAPMVVMIENYRSGLLWKLFMSNDEIKAGLQKIARHAK